MSAAYTLPGSRIALVLASRPLRRPARLGQEERVRRRGCEPAVSGHERDVKRLREHGVTRVVNAEPTGERGVPRASKERLHWMHISGEREQCIEGSESSVVRDPIVPIQAMKRVRYLHVEVRRPGHFAPKAILRDRVAADERPHDRGRVEN